MPKPHSHQWGVGFEFGLIVWAGGDISLPLPALFFLSSPQSPRTTFLDPADVDDFGSAGSF